MSDRDTNAPPLVEHTYSDDTPPSVAITRAVCAVENVDPLHAPDSLPFTLYDHFDPEALDELIAANPDVRVTLQIMGYHIEITRQDVILRAA